MTTRNASTARPDVQSIATAVAAELPGVWSVACVRRGEHIATLIRDDGLTLNASYDRAYNAPANRLCIGQDYYTAVWVDSAGRRVDPTNYGESLPSIKITAKKKPATIAREIVRRLLPDCEAMHAKAIACMRARNAYDASKIALEIASGVTAAGLGGGSGGGWQHFEGYAGPEDMRPTGRAEAKVSPQYGVDLELCCLSAAQTRAVLSVLGLIPTETT